MNKLTTLAQKTTSDYFLKKIWIHKVAIIFFVPLPQQPMFVSDLSCTRLGIAMSIICQIS